METRWAIPLPRAVSLHYFVRCSVSPPPPSPHGSRSANSGNIAASRATKLRSSSTLALSSPTPPLRVHTRDDKLARLGSARKPRFCLVMDRNEHLWTTREAIVEETFMRIGPFISKKKYPFLSFPLVFGNMSSFKKSIFFFL